MKQRRIQLQATDDVQEFVKAAAGCDFDISLQCERAIVDAKSFLGVLSLGICRILTVTYQGADRRFEEIIKKYSVA